MLTLLFIYLTLGWVQGPPTVIKTKCCLTFQEPKPIPKSPHTRGRSFLPVLGFPPMHGRHLGIADMTLYLVYLSWLTKADLSLYCACRLEVCLIYNPRLMLCDLTLVSPSTSPKYPTVTTRQMQLQCGLFHPIYCSFAWSFSPYDITDQSRGLYHPVSYRTDIESPFQRLLPLLAWTQNLAILSDSYASRNVNMCQRV